MLLYLTSWAFVQGCNNKNQQFARKCTFALLVCKSMGFKLKPSRPNLTTDRRPVQDHAGSLNTRSFCPVIFKNSLLPRINIPYQRPKSHTSTQSTCEKNQPQLVFFSLESHLASRTDAPYHPVMFGHIRSLSIIGTDELTSSSMSFHRAS